MEHIRRLWSFLKSKNETTVGNGDEVGHPEASRPIFATTTFVERDSSMSLEGDELFQVSCCFVPVQCNDWYILLTLSLSYAQYTCTPHSVPVLYAQHTD